MKDKCWNLDYFQLVTTKIVQQSVNTKDVACVLLHFSEELERVKLAEVREVLKKISKLLCSLQNSTL